MTAQEAYYQSVWSRIPNEIKAKISERISYGWHNAEIYKSLYPQLFKDIDKTIANLRKLGYEVYLQDVITSSGDVNDVAETDTKLSIFWNSYEKC